MLLLLPARLLLLCGDRSGGEGLLRVGQFGGGGQLVEGGVGVEGERVAEGGEGLRALREGRAGKVFLACDADPTVTGRVEDACASVPVERNFTMAQLGSAAGIAVGAAVVTLLNG